MQLGRIRQPNPTGVPPVLDPNLKSHPPRAREQLLFRQLLKMAASHVELIISLPYAKTCVFRNGLDGGSVM